MVKDRQEFITKITLYRISRFHFCRWNLFKSFPWPVHYVQETAPNFLWRVMRVERTADNADISQSHSANHHRLLSHVTQRRMQEVNSLCTGSRVLRAEYCIVGIPHNTVHNAVDVRSNQLRREKLIHRCWWKMLRIRSEPRWPTINTQVECETMKDFGVIVGGYGGVTCRELLWWTVWLIVVEHIDLSSSVPLWIFLTFVSIS